MTLTNTAFAKAGMMTVNWELMRDWHSDSSQPNAWAVHVLVVTHVDVNSPFATLQRIRSAF
jgi:hypothetical protein